MQFVEWCFQMVNLYKDPKGEHIFKHSMSQYHPTNTYTLSDAEREKLRNLERHCKDLETRLGRYEVKILYTGLGNWRNCRRKLATVRAWIRQEREFFRQDRALHTHGSNFHYYIFSECVISNE